MPRKLAAVSFLVVLLGAGAMAVLVATTDRPTADRPSTPPIRSTDAASSAAAHSGQAMPVGDLPGWRQVFTDDFTTPVPPGQFPGPVYGARWAGYDGYPDTSENGRYTPSRVLSVSHGLLDMYLHTENGRPMVAAPVPFLDPNCRYCGQTYGRFTVRFKADPVPGYKTAWLLWPTSDRWADGEIDFPEGPLDGTIGAFVHCVGRPEKNCLQVNTGTTFTTWHTATTEWMPGRVRFIFDGRVIGTSNASPSTPMRWTLQTETWTEGPVPMASAAGHVFIDWVAIYTLGSPAPR